MKNNVYPCKPQFHYIKVGFQGVKIIKACFRDDPFVFSVSVFCSQIFIIKLNSLPTIGLTYAISIDK